MARGEMHGSGRRIYAGAAFWIFLVLGCCTGLAAQKRDAVGGSASSSGQEELKTDPRVVRGRLANGLRYAIMTRNDSGYPDTSFRLLVATGSLDETPEQYGIAHFLEHAVFLGFDGVTDPDFVNKAAAKVGIQPDTVNASTDAHATIFQLDLPDAEPEHIDAVLKILRGYADGATLPEAEIRRERGVIIREMEEDNQDERLALKARDRFFFPGMKSDAFDVIGSAESLGRIGAAELRAFYEGHYTPERMTLVVSGGVRAKTLLPMIERNFASLKAKGVPVPPADAGTLLWPACGLRAAFHLRKAPAGEASVAFGNVRPYRPLTTRQAVRKFLRESMVRAMLNRRWENLADAENSAILSLTAEEPERYGGAEEIIVTAVSRDGAWQGCCAELEHELRRALQHGFTEAELAAARAEMLKTCRSAWKKRDEKHPSETADGICSALEEGGTITSEADDLKDVEAAAGGFDNRAAQEALRRMFGVAGGVFVTGGSPVAGGAEEILQAWKSAASVPVTAPAAQTIPAFACPAIGKPGKPVSRKKIRDLGILQARFENNVRLNVMALLQGGRSKGGDGSVQVQVRLGGGLASLPSGAAGLPHLVEGTLLAGGTRHHSADELGGIFAGKEAGWQFRAESGAFIFSCETNAADLEDALRLLCGYLTEAGWRKNAISRFHKGLPAAFRNTEMSTDGMLMDRVVPWLYGDDARVAVPPPDKLAALTLAQAAAWMDPVLRGGYIEVAVCGDITEPAALAAVGATLGAIPPRAATPPSAADIPPVRFAEGAHEKTFLLRSAEKQAAAYVCWPVRQPYDARAERELRFLGAVLNTRVGAKVRNGMGAAYSISADGRLSLDFPGTGDVTVIVKAAPERLDAVLAAIVDCGADLASGGLTEEEFQAVYEPFLAEVLGEADAVDYMAETVLPYCQAEPRRLDWVRSAESDATGITRERISALAARVLVRENAVKVRITPAAQAAPRQDTRTRPGGGRG